MRRHYLYIYSIVYLRHTHTHSLAGLAVRDPKFDARLIRNVARRYDAVDVVS